MTGILKVVAIAALVTTGAFFCGTLRAAEEYADPDMHYRFDLPDDWEIAPSSAVEETTRLAVEMSGVDSVKYVAGFQKRSGRWFTYPYMLIQHHRVGDAATIEILAALRGEGPDATEELESTGFVTNIETGKSVIDRKRKMVLMSGSMVVMGVVPVKFLTAFAPGKSGAVQLNFYAIEEDWDEHAPVFEGILDSFAFDGGYEHSEARGYAMWFLRILSNPVYIGIVVGLVFGIVAAIRSRRRKRRAAARDRERAPFPGPDEGGGGASC